MVSAKQTDPFTRRRVLIVEDTDVVRRTVSALMRRLGMEVTPAVDAQQALDLLRLETFDLVVTDLDLGDPQRDDGQEGLEIIAEVRRRSPETGVILMSGSCSPAQRVAALARGAAVVLSKPFGLEVLEAAIERALRR